MKRMTALPRIASILALGIVSAISAAHAATDATGQSLTLTPSADESTMSLLWIPATDDFGPPAPCNIKPYTLTLSNDETIVQIFNEQNSPLLTDTNGKCFLQKTILPGAVYATKVSPGVWNATASRPIGSPIAENRAIYACTALQGKRPMYWTRYSPLTDNFYTTSTSQRDTSISIGFSNRGTPFTMPNQARFGSAPFYRYYKSAPQYEHFYTSAAAEWRYVEQNGYTYEGIEGYIFKNYKPGTVALRRYALFNGANGDLQHYYTIIQNDPGASGWGYDGIVGYVCAP
jgi:hypothetical protein